MEAKLKPRQHGKKLRYKEKYVNIHEIFEEKIAKEEDGTWIISY